MTVSIHLPAGQKLTVVSSGNTTGSVWEMSGTTPGTPYAVAAGETLGLGPFHLPRTYAIASVNGTLDVTAAATDDQPYGMQRQTLAGNRTEVIPDDHNVVVFGDFTVNGRLTVDGTLNVVAQPVDSPLPVVRTTITSNRADVIPADHQLCMFGALVVRGSLTVNGYLSVTTLPALA